jgi:hypothetical protein
VISQRASKPPCDVEQSREIRLELSGVDRLMVGDPVAETAQVVQLIV